jgi:putative selenate reductase molybdopterin-binding subunit
MKNQKKECRDKHQFSVVNHSVRKIDAIGLAAGKREFTDDIRMKGMLETAFLRSPHAHARIVSADSSEAEQLAGVHAIVHHFNTPHVMHTTAGQGFPEPSPYDTLMFNAKARFVGDPVAAVAAETPEIARKAVSLIKIDYEILEPALDVIDVLRPGSPIVHDEKDCFMPIPVPYHPDKNIAAVSEFEVGNIEAGLRDSGNVFDHTYTSHYTSHCAIEPHAVIAWIDPDNRLIIRCSTQVPFHVRRIVARVLQIPVSRIRVIKPRIGGGFGGKQEVFLEAVAGILALRTGRPIRLVLTRKEVFTAARTRHPQVMRLRTGLNADGTVTTVELDTIMNTGAYGSHALTVVCNTGAKVLPLLNKAPNVAFRARSVYTNLPIGGAYRGYGATQGSFALNVQMDEMAYAAGYDVVDLWRKNHIRTGETSPVFKALGEGTEGVDMIIGSCGLPECIDRGVEDIEWHRYRNKKIRDGDEIYGVGMACLMQGSSIPEIDMASASIKINEDGSFNLLVGATDLGTGSDTVLAQIAAETLGVSMDKIVVYSSDTDLTPFDVGAYASSTTYLSGEAVRRAAEKIRLKILETAAEIWGTDIQKLTLEKDSITCPDTARHMSFADIAVSALYNRNQHQIQATASAISHRSPPPFSAHFARVAVDINTGQVRVVTYVAAVDCGTAINPKLAEGQTEGGVMNAISSALWENYEFTDTGRMRNPSFTHYKIGMVRDMPDIRTILIPTYEDSGPYGAKSVSEICTNGPMPVLSNAIFDAVGIRLREAPFTAERIWTELQNRG